MREDSVYVMSGKNILRLLELIEHLRDTALDYAEEVGEDVNFVKEKFDILKEDILKSDIFEEVNYNELIDSYSLSDILDSLAISLMLFEALRGLPCFKLNFCLNVRLLILIYLGFFFILISQIILGLFSLYFFFDFFFNFIILLIFCSS